MVNWDVLEQELSDSVLRVLRWIYLGITAALAFEIIARYGLSAYSLGLIIGLYLFGVAVDLIFKHLTGIYGENADPGRKESRRAALGPR